jgi:hypothetical protein
MLTYPRLLRLFWLVHLRKSNPCLQGRFDMVLEDYRKIGGKSGLPPGDVTNVASARR